MTCLDHPSSISPALTAARMSARPFEPRPGMTRSVILAVRGEIEAGAAKQGRRGHGPGPLGAVSPGG